MSWYVAEGAPCPLGGQPGPAAGPRFRAADCPTCGQRLWFAAPDGLWPVHWVAPEGEPGDVEHRNDGVPPLEARASQCAACAGCDHEADDPACMDNCYERGAGAWLPFEAAWACDSCGHPVVRAEAKRAVLGTWD